MAGALTIGGEAAGLLSGAKQIGPVTMVGRAFVGTIVDVSLAAGDNTIAVPKEASAVLIVFPYVNEPAEVRLRTNLNPLDSGLPVLAGGFSVFPLPATVTSLIVHLAAGAASAELSFI